jgi:hypothetical protein
MWAHHPPASGTDFAIAAGGNACSPAILGIGAPGASRGARYDFRCGPALLCAVAPQRQT